MTYTGRINPAAYRLCPYPLDDRELADAAARAGVPLYLDTPEQLAAAQRADVLHTATYELGKAVRACDRYRRNLTLSRAAAAIYRGQCAGGKMSCAHGRTQTARLIRYDRNALHWAQSRVAAAQAAVDALMPARVEGIAA